MSSKNYILYKDRPEWEDVHPLPLLQQPGDPFPVAYTTEYEDMLGYFFAVLERKEVSARAMEITERVIKTIPSHYTAWWFKFYLLERMEYDFDRELEFLNKCIVDCPKSYQSWHYRMWLVERAENKPDEVAFVRKVFCYDAKNFHAWTYILWFGQKYGAQPVYQLSLDLIEEDPRNNSAWNGRKTTGDLLGVDPKTEFKAAADSIRQITKNEASINFALAMYEKDPSLLPELRDLAREMVERNSENPHALRMQLFVATIDNDRDQITELCKKLCEADPLRENYYNLVANGTLSYR